MKTFGRYLSYRLKQSWLRTLIFTVLAIILTQNTMIGELKGYYPESGLYILAVVLGILCTILPILETADYKNRRNLDSYYSFAISRKKLAWLHYLSGWIQIAVIYSVTYLFACLTLSTHQTPFSLIYLLPYYFGSLALGLVMYSVFLFLFGEGNTVVDGVLFCVLGIFGLTMLLSLVQELIRVFSSRSSLPFVPFWGCVYTPINNLTVVVLHWLHGMSDSSRSVAEILEQSYMFAVWFLLGVAAAVGYFYTFTRKRAETIGDISKSWFGYKTMVPIYAFSLLFMGAIGGGFIFIFILMLSGYFIYRRSFKLRKSDVIVLAGYLLLSVLGAIL